VIELRDIHEASHAAFALAHGLAVLAIEPGVTVLGPGEIEALPPWLAAAVCLAGGAGEAHYTGRPPSLLGGSLDDGIAAGLLLRQAGIPQTQHTACLFSAQDHCTAYLALPQVWAAVTQFAQNLATRGGYSTTIEIETLFDIYGLPRCSLPHPEEPAHMARRPRGASREGNWREADGPSEDEGTGRRCSDPYRIHRGQPPVATGGMLVHQGQRTPVCWACLTRASL
jgi:hypothetical protein